MNNDFGGTAVYSDVFNFSNKFQNGEYLQVQGAPNIQLRLSWPMKLETTWLLPWPLDGPGAKRPKLIDRADFCQLEYEPCPDYPNVFGIPWDQGHKNVKGLNTAELQKLMKAGLMIDLAHMSERSMDEALTLGESFSYPLMNSHTSLRNPKVFDAFAGPKPKKRVTSERDMTFDQVKRMAALGGVLGMGTEGRLEPQSLASFEFNPDTALNSKTTELSLELSKSSSLAPTDPIQFLDVTVVTGDDDLRGGNDNAFVLVSLKNQTGLDVSLNGTARLADRSSYTMSVPMPAGVQLQDITEVGIRTQLSGDDWHVDSITATATSPAGKKQLIHREGQPFRSFSSKYSKWLESVDTDPALNLGTLVKTVNFTFKTGKDDLRGDQDNLWIRVRRRNTGVTTLMANGRASWPANSKRTASVGLPAATHLADLESIELETTFSGGTGGDNWDLQSIAISTDDGNGNATDLMTAEGQPWKRFSQEDKHKTAWIAPPEADDDLTPARFLRITVVSGHDGLDKSTQATASIILKDLSRKSIDFNLGGSLEDYSTYWRIIDLPPGTQRDSLKAVVLSVTNPGNDTWRISRVTVEVLADPVENFIADYQEALAPMGGITPGLGTDMNGFAPQIPFSAALFDYPLHAPNNHAPANLKNQVPLIDRAVFGQKTYDFLKDGVAHYGMLAELIEATNTFPGGPAVVDELYSSAEATIRMWEACEAAAAKVP